MPSPEPAPKPTPSPAPAPKTTGRKRSQTADPEVRPESDAGPANPQRSSRAQLTRLGVRTKLHAPAQSAPTPPPPPPTFIKYPIKYYKTQEAPPGTFTVQVSTAHADEECPLTLDPIASSELEWLPGRCLIEGKPAWTKMTLPCGHAFSALPLFYHFCKNNLRCPCCRSGEDGAIGTESIPPHLIHDFVSHITQLKAADRLEEDQEALESIRRMVPTVATFADIANRGRLSMTIQISTRPQGQPIPPPIAMGVQLIPVYIEDDAQNFHQMFRPSESQLQVLSQLRGVGDTIQLSIRMRLPHFAEDTYIDTTAPFPIPAESEFVAPAPVHPSGYRSSSAHTTSVRAGRQGLVHSHWQGPDPPPDLTASTSAFQLGFDRQDGEVYLSDICWRPDASLSLFGGY